jgi:hypothetical protein
MDVRLIEVRDRPFAVCLDDILELRGIAFGQASLLRGKLVRIETLRVQSLLER